MSRSNHHGCGKKCFLCRPEKFAGNALIAAPTSARRVLQEPIDDIPQTDVHPFEIGLPESDEPCPCGDSRCDGIA